MTPTRLTGSRALMLILALAGAALIPIVVSSRSQPAAREIRLTVRNMAFYLEGNYEPNPTLRVRRGETIRLVLTNADPGMTHDLGIDTWSVRTRPLDYVSRVEAAIEFRAPTAAGDAEYSCTPHKQMMRGTIRVE